nr:unnamed protein product [Callosobruchus analis]
MQDYITSPLLHLINLSLTVGKFPDVMKTTIIYTMFRKDNGLVPANYRRISLLSGFSNVLERCVYNILISFVERNNLLFYNQHGFRKNKSTESATYHLLKFDYECLDNGSYVIVSRAFDCLRH